MHIVESSESHNYGIDIKTRGWLLFVAIVRLNEPRIIFAHAMTCIEEKQAITFTKSPALLKVIQELADLSNNVGAGGLFIQNFHDDCSACSTVN